MSELQVGELVFFSSDSKGIYLGNNKFLEFDRSFGIRTSCGDTNTVNVNGEIYTIYRTTGKVFDIGSMLFELKRPPESTGYWIPICNKKGTEIAVRCSICRNSPKRGIRSNFCPNCGVKMAEKGDSE